MVRRITSHDREVYIKLATEFYNSDAVISSIPRENIIITFNEMLSSNNYAEGFLLECDDKIVGYALLAKTFSQEAGGLTIWIEELYVRKEYRGRGLGSEFFEFLEKNFPAARYRLEIEPDNERAISLYEKWGFKPLHYGQMIKQN